MVASSSIFPNVQAIALVNDWLVHQQTTSNPPDKHVRAKLPTVARILYTLIGLLFSRTKLWPSCCYLTFFHFPERSIALKRLAGSPKGVEIDPEPASSLNVRYSSTRILIYIDGSLYQPCPSCCYLTSFHFP
jgi:hypothetical protein